MVSSSPMGGPISNSTGHEHSPGEMASPFCVCCDAKLGAGRVLPSSAYSARLSGRHLLWWLCPMR
jgi:hypothetical protein